MSQCQGKTKLGDRCKRSTREGSRFCATHTNQAQNPSEASSPAGASTERGVLEAVVAIAAAGLVLVAVLTARRLFRFV